LASDAVLYVVATPIGNLADMVPRAVSILQSVALIAAEDTRHSRRLLDHFNIRTRCVSYHDHSDAADLAALLAELQAGRSIALISDAGTPLVSDPGYRLVDGALNAGFDVVPVPGPCALIAALSAAGLPTDRFVFEGFLPAKAGARRQRLEHLQGEARTLVFYEAPHRLLETLADMEAVFGAARVAVLARELTKLHETIHRAPLAELRAWALADPNQSRGECVVLVQGCAQSTGVDADSERVLRLLLDELPLKQAAALAAKITGQKKNELYQLALTWQKPAPA
jgi:16S rRNA (cytidine1402-2'-O)-methyltransferase